MKVDLNTIIIIAGFVVLFFVLNPGDSKGTNKTITEIETRIKDSIIFVDRIKEVVRVDKIYLDTLYVNRYNSTDTVRIIQIQDTIIIEQKNVIINQDTVINTQSNVILAKDTVIFLKDIKIKKKNKDIIKLGLIALGTSIISILK